MELKKRIQVVTVVAFLCVSIDQITKLIAAEYLPRNMVRSYFIGTLRIGYTENIGAFLGLGNGLSDEFRFGIFVLGVSVFLCLGITYLVTSPRLSANSLFAISMTLSGGASNLYDRVINNGAVVDFLNIGFGSFRTGIFNIADIAIVVGALLLLLLGSKPVTGR
ncbi:signal peptidase II [Vibrio sp. HI00D65]|uniref:signal peptidase II n=1 Tax=Vibrio sp. HI00D65 TaxID=1822216 RepID=UPI0007B9C0AA|nr:signal peptidase II [Vibrio sp. HI00D65]KZX65697.1 signal peptidase II [Vibrio sp. HI00D65]